MSINLKHLLFAYSDSLGRKLIWKKHNKNAFRNKVFLSNEFAESNIAKKIICATAFLPIETPLQYRVKAVLLDITDNSKCIVCGKSAMINHSFVLSDPFFIRYCSRICQARFAAQHKITTDKSKINHSVSMLMYKKKLFAAYQRCCKSFHDNSYVLKDYAYVRDYAKTRIAQQKRNGSIVQQKEWFTNIDLICSIIYHTRFIDFPASISSIKDFQLNERLYCLFKDIHSIPKCRFCQNIVNFINVRHGYNESCLYCTSDKMRANKMLPTTSVLINMIDKTKYEIVDLDDRYGSKNKHLSIKCKKCNCITTFNLHTRCLRHYVESGKLCRICDRYVSTEELALRDIIKHKIKNANIYFNDRTIIAPYELDIVIPSMKMAIEYNGLFWHNAGVVDKFYHMRKSVRCEKSGYSLIHVFENQWKSNKKLCISLIEKALQTNTIKTFNVEQCSISTSLQQEYLCKFIKKYSFVKYSCNFTYVGLLFRNHIVALAAFEHNNDIWTLVDYCELNNFIIINGVIELCKFFIKLRNAETLNAELSYNFNSISKIRKFGFNFVECRQPAEQLINTGRSKKKLSIYDAGTIVANIKLN